jgi:hypothetical protein
MTYTPEPDQVARLQQELGLIRQEMDLPLETEVEPIVQDGSISFLLASNELVWLAADGAVCRDRYEDGVHLVDTIRGNVVIDHHEIPGSKAR